MESKSAYPLIFKLKKKIMDEYLFAVVIPIYNKGDVLERAIRSVLNQTFTDYELILVNDGSCDNSEEVCMKFCNDDRIKYIYQDNAGVSVARNCGILSSHAMLITFLDPDDEWYSDHLESLYKAYIENKKAKALYSTAYDISLFDGKIISVKKMTYSSLFREKEYIWKLYDNPFAIGNTFKYPPIHTNSIMIPKEIFQMTGYFLPGCKKSQDTDMWYRIGLQYPFVLINKSTTLYHREDSTATKSQKMNYNWPFLKTADAFIKNNPQHRLTESLKECVDVNRISMARHLIMEGKKDEARIKLIEIYGEKNVKWRLILTKILLYLPHQLIAKLYRFLNNGYLQYK